MYWPSGRLTAQDLQTLAKRLFAAPSLTRPVGAIGVGFGSRPVSHVGRDGLSQLIRHSRRAACCMLVEAHTVAGVSLEVTCGQGQVCACMRACVRACMHA